MKKIYKLLILLTLSLFAFQSCEDMDDTIKTTPGLEVESFIYNGLNLYYLWKEDVPDLADNRFINSNERNDFLRSKASPEILFQDLLFKPISKFPRIQSVDRFSILVPDYTYLENIFAGITKNNGVDYSLRYKQTGSNVVFGWVRYIIPNSDASGKDIKRGDIFYAVNGTVLNDENYTTLLGQENYTLNLADFDNGAITPNGKSVTLTKTQLTENPVFHNSVITNGNHKIAYLVYNGFTANFDSQLNTAFGEFLSAGATDLVLDLRYNSGGSIRSAARLASMITGQFNGQIFTKQQWNPEIQAIFENQNPDNLVEKFTNSVGNASINSLNLSKVYILTTGSTASASELVINSLKPYIDVIQIGTTTTGKNVGSITLYDSPTLVSKDNRSSKHKYAMQPLVIKTVNKEGFGDYQNGLVPNFEVIENLGNLNQLGNVNETLLSTAINLIISGGRMMPGNPEKQFREFKDSKSMRRFGTDMYINELPEADFGIPRKF